MFSLLPDTFIKADVYGLYEQQGRDPKKAELTLRQWVFRGKVVHDTQNGLYLKNM